MGWEEVLLIVRFNAVFAGKATLQDTSLPRCYLGPHLSPLLCLMSLFVQSSDRAEGGY